MGNVRGYLQVMKDLGMNSIFTGITEMPYGNIVKVLFPIINLFCPL
jgi:hypothetical protein